MERDRMMDQTMDLYYMTIVTEAGFHGALHSDTLFGAFCWSYGYQYGEDALLSDVISPAIHNEPAVIFSNGFMHGNVPMPMGVKDQSIAERRSESDKRKIRLNYAKVKKLKKATLISVDAFKQLQNGADIRISEHQSSNQTENIVYQHNAVDREDGIVKKTDDGSHLFSVTESYDASGEGYDVYILTRLEKGRLEKVVSMMLQLGIGGKKSTGQGAFRMKNPLTTCNDLLDVNKATHYVTISNYIPDKDDPTDGWYKTDTKYARLDREYANSEYPFKKPFIYIRTGAVFKDNGTIASRGWCGRCLTDIAVQKKDIIQSGHTIVLPLKITM